MVKNLLDFLKKEEVEFSLKEDLSKKSFIGIGGVYDTVSPSSIKSFVAVLEFLTEHGIPFRIIGNLSNTIITDKHIEVIVKTDKMLGYNVAENRVSTLCGEIYLKLFSKLACLDISLSPQLSGIPGSIGGMIYSNAGAYGVEISDIFIEALAYDFLLRRLVRLYKDDMGFSYRKSILSDRRLAIISADFIVEKIPCADIRRAKYEFAKKRMASQPTNSRTLGSVFKRPDGIIAAKLIDELGLKGFTVGGASVSEKHAGFIVNNGYATADDIVSLISVIKRRVFEEYGITLEEEIEII